MAFTLERSEAVGGFWIASAVGSVDNDVSFLHRFAITRLACGRLTSMLQPRPFKTPERGSWISKLSLFVSSNGST